MRSWLVSFTASQNQSPASLACPPCSRAVGRCLRSWCAGTGIEEIRSIQSPMAVTIRKPGVAASLKRQLVTLTMRKRLSTQLQE